MNALEIVKRAAGAAIVTDAKRASACACRYRWSSYWDQGRPSTTSFTCSGPFCDGAGRTRRSNTFWRIRIADDDTHVGSLGTVCAGDAPKTLIYSVYIGPFSDPADCGEQLVDNTASFVTNDRGTTGEDSWTVTVNVVCDTGCTLTPGYWKTHSEYGPAPYDETWALLPSGADTPFFLSGQSYYQVLWTPPKGGNAYYILAHAYIAAQLNFLNGASAPDEVMAAFNDATDLLETHTPAGIAALKGSKTLRQDFLERELFSICTTMGSSVRDTAPRTTRAARGNRLESDVNHAGRRLGTPPGVSLCARLIGA